MAKRVEGVTEKLLESAKKEFLKSGYENASLQVLRKKQAPAKALSISDILIRKVCIAL